jgi:hypothetical protein
MFCVIYKRLIPAVRRIVGGLAREVAATVDVIDRSAALSVDTWEAWCNIL